MRPKKRILIWARCETTGSVLRVVLDVHGYAARVLKGEEEIWQLAGSAHACLVVGWPSAEAERIARRVYREFACRCVIATKHGAAAEGVCVAELLDLLRRPTWRKRVPGSGRLSARAREFGARVAAKMAAAAGKEDAA